MSIASNELVAKDSWEYCALFRTFTIQQIDQEIREGDFDWEAYITDAIDGVRSAQDSAFRYFAWDGVPHNPAIAQFDEGGAARMRLLATCDMSELEAAVEALVDEGIAAVAECEGMVWPYTPSRVAAFEADIRKAVPTANLTVFYEGWDIMIDTSRVLTEEEVRIVGRMACASFPEAADPFYLLRYPGAEDNPRTECLPYRCHRAPCEIDQARPWVLLGTQFYRAVLPKFDREYRETGEEVWLREQTRGRWLLSENFVEFEDLTDAIQFKLAWC